MRKIEWDLFARDARDSILRELRKMGGSDRYKFVYTDGSVRFFDGKMLYGKMVVRCPVMERHKAVVIVDLLEKKFIKNRLGEPIDRYL